MNLYAILTLFVISYQASALNVENASLVYKQKYVINNFELIYENETITNCFSSVKIKFKIENSYVYAFLYTYGALSPRQIESQCFRTKL